jgi:hypothetical protein
MIGTSRPAIRFCCPECGADMRAPRADAGSAIDCDRCGESVRVPRFPHPKESESDTPLVSPAAAATAGSGLRLLTAGLGVWAAWFALTVAVGVAWAGVLGPDAVYRRDQGDLRPWLLAAGVLEVLLVWVGAGLRWVGYGRCRDAATAVRAAGWVTAARVGLLVGATGQTFAAWPMLLGLPADRTPGNVRAIGQVAEAVRAVGFVLECGVVFVWVRLLTEAGGRGAARPVNRFMVSAAVAFAATFCALCAAGSVVVIAARTRGRFPADLFATGDAPPEAWSAIAAVLGVVAGAAGVLGWQYFRILAATRSVLDGGPGRTPPTGG